MNKLVKNELLNKFISWLLRTRPPEILLFKYSIYALVAIFGLDFIGGIFVSSDKGGIGAILSPGDLIPTVILYPIAIILCLVLLISLLIVWIKFIDLRKIESRKKVIVIEGRGLRADDGNALIDAIPSSLSGYKQDYILDLRPLIDGTPVDPHLRLENIATMRQAIQQMSKGIERNDLTLIYGGLTSVPLTFLTGIELDDEGKVITLDWDRNQEKWRELNEEDDGDRFHVDGLESIKDQENAVLAVSVSYPIDQDDLCSTFNWPIVRMSLRQLSSNSHWSIEKQVALADEFLETAKKLSASGVKRIHLVLAAPNSIVFLFGRRFDKRNLPNIVVYQYERGNDSLAYPWGVDMPVAGKQKASIVETTST